MADLDQPPLKRARLDIDEAVPDSKLSGYMLLKEECHRIDVDDTQTVKILLNAEHTECSLISYDPARRALKLRLQRPGTTVLATVQHGSVDTIDPTILDDCLQLPSAIKKSQSHSLSALALYSMRIRHQQSSLWLNTRVFWQDAAEARSQVPQSLRNLLAKYTSTSATAPTGDSTPWEVREFYDNVHVPLTASSEPIHISNVQFTLYPFQNRALKWLLAREQVSVTNVNVIRGIPLSPSTLPLDFRTAKDAAGSQVYVSDALATMCSTREQVQRQYPVVRGGLLAEAMGLGKTVYDIWHVDDPFY